MQRTEIRICLGSSCFARGNQNLVHQIKDFLRRKQLEDQVVFKGARCFNACKNGPVMQIGDRLFDHLDQRNIEELLISELTTHDAKR